MSNLQKVKEFRNVSLPEATMYGMAQAAGFISWHGSEEICTTSIIRECAS